MKPLPLLLLAAEAGEKLTEDEQARLTAEWARAEAYWLRLWRVNNAEAVTGTK